MGTNSRNTYSNVVHLRDILRPLKVSLAVVGIQLSHSNTTRGNLVTVTFSTANYNDCLKVIIDTRGLREEGVAQKIKEQLFNMLVWLSENIYALSGEELAFLKEINETEWGVKKFHGDVSNLAYGLAEIEMITIDSVEADKDMWLASMTKRGDGQIKNMLQCKL